MSDLPIHDYKTRQPAPHSWPRQILTTSSRILIWGAVQFCLSFAEQVAELLAPLLFVAGVIWWAALHVIASVQLDDQLEKVVQHVPTSLVVGGHLATPGRLVQDGLLLMALVAACRTVNGIIAKET